jgi:toxin ParE1/3/4
MKLCWFHPEALEESDHAAAFYREKHPGLEIRFLEALNDAISRIRRNPFLYRCIDGDIRKCRIMRFPYGVIYRIRGDQVEVIAIAHLRQQPDYWKSRD